MKFRLRVLNEYKNNDMTNDNWFNAVDTGNIDLIKEYINNGFDVNCKVDDFTKNTALIKSCIKCNYNIVEELLSVHLIDVNYQNNWNSTALMWACLKNNLIIVKKLLTHPNIDVNIGITNNITALKYAKKVDNDEMIELLIKAGAKE